MLARSVKSGLEGNRSGKHTPLEDACPPGRSRSGVDFAYEPLNHARAVRFDARGPLRLPAAGRELAHVADLADAQEHVESVGGGPGPGLCLDTHHPALREHSPRAAPFRGHPRREEPRSRPLGGRFRPHLREVGSPDTVSQANRSLAVLTAFWAPGRGLGGVGGSWPRPLVSMHPGQLVQTI